MKIETNKMLALVEKHTDYYDDPEEGQVSLGKTVTIVAISEKESSLDRLKQLLEKGTADEEGYCSSAKMKMLRKIFPEYDDFTDYKFSIEPWDCPKIIE
jgi:hypothetical protein